MGKYEAFEKEYRAYLKRNNLGSRPIQDHEWASIGWEMALAWADTEREKETCECVVRKPWLKPGDFCCDCGRRVEVSK